MDNVSAKQKIIIQAVCILLSIGLWFYVTNIESPTITYDLNKVPVELTNTEVLEELDLALAPNQNFYVNLKLEGATQDIFKVSRSDFKVVLDLSEYALKVGENRVPVSIVDFPSKINVRNTNVLTVVISIEERVEKEMFIVSNINVIARPGYYVSEPFFNPQVVTVFGAKSLVDKVNVVLAEGTEENISDTVVKSYYLKCMDESGNSIDGIEISQKAVTATIVVNEGKSVPIKINTIGNLKDGIKLKSVESEITQVGLSASKEVLDSIGEIETEPIDLSNINEYTEMDVKLVIPSGVKIYEGKDFTTVKITVEKVESKEFTISFSIINIAEGLSAVPSIDEINVKVLGYKEDIDRVKAEDIIAKLDLSKYDKEGSFSEVPIVTLVDTNLNVTIETLGKIQFEIVKETRDGGTEEALEEIN